MVLINGVPGVGKTTLAGQHTEEPLAPFDPGDRHVSQPNVLRRPEPLSEAVGDQDRRRHRNGIADRGVLPLRNWGDQAVARRHLSMLTQD